MIEDDADLSCVLYEHALRDFYAEEMVGDPVFLGSSFHLGEDVTGEEVHAGEVDGNRDDRYAVIQAGAEALADLF